MGKSVANDMHYSLTLTCTTSGTGRSGGDGKWGGWLDCWLDCYNTNSNRTVTLRDIAKNHTIYWVCTHYDKIKWGGYHVPMAVHSNCKNIWVTSIIFWSSQVHACCVHNTLQNLKGCFLFESKLKFCWEASPLIRIFLQKVYSYLVTLLAFLP